MPYWCLYYHVVWSTKRREPWLIGGRVELAERAIRHRMRELNIRVMGLAIMPDHVHIAVSIPPNDRIAWIVQQMKGSSSFLIGARDATAHDEGFAWQRGYAVRSLSETGLPVVLDYIANQHEHHESQTLWRGLESWGDENDPADTEQDDGASRRPQR